MSQFQAWCIPMRKVHNRPKSVSAAAHRWARSAADGSSLLVSALRQKKKARDCECPSAQRITGSALN